MMDCRSNSKQEDDNKYSVTQLWSQSIHQSINGHHHHQYEKANTKRIITGRVCLAAIESRTCV